MFVKKQVRQRDHLSNEYASLKCYIGDPLKYIGGLRLYAEPSKVRLIGDYENTILIEMEFSDSVFGDDESTRNPRRVRQAISKSSLAIGEVRLEHAITGEPLYGSTIALRVPDREVFLGYKGEIIKSQEW